MIKKEDLPYPFNSQDCTIDYKVREGQNDHDWLDKHDYLISEMHSDCSFTIIDIPWFSPSSYGNWGTVYNDTNEEGWEIFSQMFEEGVISLFRSRDWSRKPVRITTKPYTIEDYKVGIEPEIIQD